MSRNRRKNANTVRIAACAWWLIIFIGIGGIGLCYVSIKNQTLAFAAERGKLERQLRGLNERNRALSSEATALTSRSALQKRVDSGFINLANIGPLAIVRLNANTAIVAETPPTVQILAQK